MTINELIAHLENARDYLGGDAKVHTSSDDYCCSLHNIERIDLDSKDYCRIVLTE